jgi:hypothetical protein
MAKRTITCTLSITEVKRNAFAKKNNEELADDIKDMILESCGYPEENKLLVVVSDLNVVVDK